MATVFLSHSSADAAAAKAVAQLLRNAGLTVWLELDEITPGNAWLPTLETALKASTHFVVLVGETGVRRWVEREVRYALERNTDEPGYRIIPLLLPGAIEQDLPLFLKQQQFLRLDWRQPDADSIQKVAAVIRDAPPGHVSVLPPGESPFRGLLTFDTTDALLFFGRDQQVDDLLHRLPNTHFLPVVGDSGSGKSSLVRAGLIPALLRGRLSHHGAWVMDWRIATMKPGEDPFAALAEAMPNWDPKLPAAERAGLIDKAKELLNKGIDGLSTTLAALQLPAHSRQLLVIDQFEQLFTLAKPEAASRFLDSVLHASQRSNSALHVVITLRVDFFGLCYRHPALWKLLTEHHYSLLRMAPEGLREAIEKPMALAGLRPAPGLVDTMLADVGKQPGGLALLEHALDRLWKVSGGRPPALADYEAIGRLKGAIQKHADDVMANKLATDAQREMARRMFVALTALGEGTEDSARRVSKRDLLTLPGEDAAQVLGVLADERLVTVGASEDKESVSIAHEALIREWAELRKWVDGRRADIRLQRELEESWRKWEGDEEQLLLGARLEDAVRWVRNNPGELRPEVQKFVETSRVRAQRRKLAFHVVVAVLTLLTLFAGWQWWRADGLRQESLTRQLAAESVALLPTAADSFVPAALLAVESMQRRPLIENHAALRQSTALLARQVSSLVHGGTVRAVAFSPDGKWLATGSQDSIARVMDAATGKEVSRLAHQGPVSAVAFSPNGTWVATGSMDMTARVMDTATGKEVSRLAHQGFVTAVAFSPDGALVATGSMDMTARLMEAATGRVVSRLDHQGSVTAVAFSPNGKWVATASEDRTARVMLAVNGRDVVRFAHQDQVRAVAFSPDGKWLASGSEDKTARVIEVATGTEVSRLAHQGIVIAVAFSPDGKHLATGSEDKTARVMEAATGKELSRLAHQDSVLAVAFSPDGKWVATGSLDDTARMMEAATGKEGAQFSHPGPVTALALSPDAKWVATGSVDDTARVMEAATGREVSHLPHQGDVSAVAFSLDGKLVATGSWDNTARVMEAATGREVSRLANQQTVDAVAFSPDGRWLVTGSGDNIARVREVATGREVSRLAHQFPVTAVAFSPDSKWVATGSHDMTARVMEASTGREVARLSHSASVRAVAFSPDGKWLATGSDDKTARVTEAATGKEVARLDHQGPVSAVAFGPNSKWLATGSQDSTARVMEAATGKELVRHRMSGPVAKVSFHGNSTLVVAQSSINAIEISHITIDPAELIGDACSRLPRNLTREEWDRYLPGERCRPTCPNLPNLCEVKE